MRPVGLILVCLYLLGSSVVVLYLSWTLWRSGTTFLGLRELLLPLVRSNSFLTRSILTYLNSIYSVVAQGVILVILACGLWLRHRWALWGTIAFQVFVLGTHFFVLGLVGIFIGLQGTNPVSLKVIAAAAILIYLLRRKTRQFFILDDRAEVIV